LSFASTIALKKDDGTSEDFVQVDLPPNQPGTKRVNTSIDYPESSALLIRSQDVGKGLNAAVRHSVTADRVVADAGGNLVRGSATLSLVDPKSTAFTAQMMVDLLHQLLDLIIATSSFDVDDAVVKSVLRGES